MMEEMMGHPKRRHILRMPVWEHSNCPAGATDKRTPWRPQSPALLGGKPSSKAKCSSVSPSRALQQHNSTD